MDRPRRSPSSNGICGTGSKRLHDVQRAGPEKILWRLVDYAEGVFEKRLCQKHFRWSSDAKNEAL